MSPLQADFAVVDDLLQEAAHARLAGHGAIAVARSGRIGPIVELAMGSLQHAGEYGLVTVEGSFAASLRAALGSGRPFGSAYLDIAGAFPLGAQNPVVAQQPDWDQWTAHADNAARVQGINSHLVAGLMGALIEMQDNVYEHSGAPATGLVAYAVTPSSFEFVVADRGAGVLATLRQNRRFAEIPDAGAALGEAIKDGVSRFPDKGRGTGFNQLFTALVGHNAELRFRSGDHALTMRPTCDALHGQIVLAKVPQLNGLAVSVICRTQSSG
jgi:hypothetical protein